AARRHDGCARRRTSRTSCSSRETSARPTLSLRAPRAARDKAVAGEPVEIAACDRGRDGNTSAPRRCYTPSVDGEHTELDIASLSRQYGPMVLRRCRQLLRDEDDALDATQDVFVRVIESRRALDARYPSSLLYRIAT